MQNRWNEAEARAFADDPLALRVYSSRLLGQDPALVLHGGGNTSLKLTVPDFFGEPQEVLYIKGSGWDLASIQAEGFAPVRLATLLKLAQLKALSDSEMVKQQRAAMLDPTAPTPSVEAILHALIPFQYVDHTHADAVVAISNSPNGRQQIEALYGPRAVIVPYVMPGFPLAQHIYKLTQGLDWAQIDGIILLNHGVFTFGQAAHQSYERMIEWVTRAEDLLKAKNVWDRLASADPTHAPDLLTIAQTRQAVSLAAGQPFLARLESSPSAVGFSQLPDVARLATQGTLTPDHIIRTKRTPAILDDTQTPAQVIQAYAEEYRAYFERYNPGHLTMLDPAPRYAIWPGQGFLTFGSSIKEMAITAEIVAHTFQAIQWAEGLGGWQALPASDLFAMEYWELEQAKLGKASHMPEFKGKIVLVTGAASGIGRACAQVFLEAGAAVVAVDINPTLPEQFTSAQCLPVIADLTDPQQIERACQQAILTFGGLDVLVSNAGIFPASYRIDAMDSAVWEKSLAINLTSHQRLMQAAIPYLKHGLNPSIVIVGSKNFPAPGPGAAAYSVAKAGVTQLGRVAALELASAGIRVNVVHPDAVFDTGIWTADILEKRAAHYQMSVQAYKTKNLLGVEITSRNVAGVIAALAGRTFAKTTGAQLPIDGGNDRVI
jgi:rhamnose utilization protein RhaD (predicted bifunctional aldolase and dehydrogenase)/NAD(P)-dependent dehydrogenase (short-subunit alcohol dehydrogenase family)